MKFENWTPENDKFLKIKEIEIHNKYHEDIASSEITLATLFETPTRKFRIWCWRWMVFSIFVQKL